MGQCRCSEQQSGGQEAVAALRSRRSRLSCRPCVGFTCVSRRRFQQRLMKRMAGLEAKGLSSSASPLVGHGIPHITADAPDPPPRSLARESSSTLSSRRLQPVCSGPLRVPRIRTAYERDGLGWSRGSLGAWAVDRVCTSRALGPGLRGLSDANVLAACGGGEGRLQS